MNKKILLSASLAVSVAIVLILAEIFVPDDELTSEQLTEYPHKRQLSYGFRVQNMTPRLSKMAEIRAYVSAAHASTQLITSIAHKNNTLVTDGLGNKLVLFKLGEMAAGESALLNIAMDLVYRDEPMKTDGLMIDLYRQTASGLEENAEKLEAIVSELKGDDSKTTVTNILAWMKENISSTEDKENPEQDLVSTLPIEDSVINILQGRDKSLTGQVYLFVALSRAAGIPARAVIGAIVGNDASNTEISEFTIWPEYSRDGAWNILDIQNHKQVSSVSNYIAFRVVENMIYQFGNTAESYLFETVSINVVPGSVKLRVKDLSSQ